ncbi:MAG: hypothetical protein JXA82_01200 [Sedimentisphaerales bacterium]|nr:hypothetical protein [Sedimentisphaerales bacterium]
MKTYKHMERDLKRLIEKIAQRDHLATQAMLEKDRSQARTYELDVKDLTDILNRIQEGDFAMAFLLANELDTVVRDQIPVRLYNFLARANGYS